MKRFVLYSYLCVLTSVLWKVTTGAQPEHQLTAQVAFLSQRDAKVVVSPAKGVSQERWKRQDTVVSRSLLGWKDGRTFIQNWCEENQTCSVSCLLFCRLSLSLSLYCIPKGKQSSFSLWCNHNYFTTITFLNPSQNMFFLTISVQHYF